MLSDNSARLRTFGANSPLNLPGRQAAAKTGLTDDARDAWAMGYTPQVAVGVWVGRKDNAPMRGATSVSVAAPIWHQVMLAALEGEPILVFAAPADVQALPVCRDTGLQPDRKCRRVVTELFVAGQIPTLGSVASSSLAPGEPAPVVAQEGPGRGRGKPKGRR